MPHIQFDNVSVSGSYDDIVRAYKDTIFTAHLTHTEFMEQVSARVHKFLMEPVDATSAESFCKDMVRVGVFVESAPNTDCN